eukprot:1562519-Prymnesium_polylepis.1
MELSRFSVAEIAAGHPGPHGRRRPRHIRARRDVHGRRRRWPGTCVRRAHGALRPGTPHPVWTGHGECLCRGVMTSCGSFLRDTGPWRPLCGHLWPARRQGRRQGHRGTDPRGDVRGANVRTPHVDASQRAYLSHLASSTLPMSRRSDVTPICWPEKSTRTQRWFLVAFERCHAAS